MYLYVIRNKINNKRYIGITKNSLRTRLTKHIYSSYHNVDNSYEYHFHRAIRKYGKENFELEFYYNYSNQNVSYHELCEAEIYFIKKYDTFKNGYNMTLGGQGSLKRNQMKKIDCYDKCGNFITSYESIESAAKELDLFPTNISACINGRTKSAGNYLFCLHGKKLNIFKNEVLRKIDIYTSDGNFVRTFESMVAAANFLDISRTTVFDCCNERQLTVKRGKYICVYAGSDITKRRKREKYKRLICIISVINNCIVVEEILAYTATCEYLKICKNKLNNILRNTQKMKNHVFIEL